MTCSNQKDRLKGLRLAWRRPGAVRAGTQAAPLARLERDDHLETRTLLSVV